jgi:elongation factor P
MAIKMDGRLFLILETEHRTPGNLRAFVQIKIRDLYQQGNMAVFMDLESYEQVELPKEVVGDLALYVLPNTQIIVLWCDGRAMSVELPLVVTLTVTDTPPGIKGATATNQLKEATCETGLKTRVPPFITIGEKVIVGTADGAYRSRA